VRTIFSFVILAETSSGSVEVPLSAEHSSCSCNCGIDHMMIWKVQHPSYDTWSGEVCKILSTSAISCASALIGDVSRYLLSPLSYVSVHCTHILQPMSSAQGR
jgi:hypothetical protein